MSYSTENLSEALRSGMFHKAEAADIYAPGFRQRAAFRWLNGVESSSAEPHVQWAGISTKTIGEKDNKWTNDLA
ncbi:MAG: hypothetical protein PHE53_03075 [Thermoguttaceae bacterium]|nr:hypothetical protein [Thermoguttaceae bacterium]